MDLREMKLVIQIVSLLTMEGEHVVVLFQSVESVTQKYV